MSENMKVYELAKELGLESMGLLDTLKECSISVKSHMSTLTEEDISKAREFLFKKAEEKTSTKKKVVRRKRTTKKATAKTSPAIPGKKKAAKVAEPAAATVVKRKVIKRRARVEPEPIPASIVAAPSPAQTVAQPAALSPEPSTAPQSSPATPAVPTEGTAETDTTAAQTTAAPVESKSTKAKKVSEDEMLDKSFARRGLKIIQAAPEKSKAPASPRKPSAGKANAADPTMPPSDPTRKASSPMFKPAQSVFSQREEDKRKHGPSSTRPKIETKVTDFRKREIVFHPRKRKLPPGKAIRKTLITEPGAKKRIIKIDRAITINELADRMKEKRRGVARKLQDLGQEIERGENLKLDIETATLLAGEFNYEVENVSFDESAFLKKDEESKNMITRPPIIAVLGHVDHGKTTLLDSIRNANVVKGEAGGITQHIGAYSVDIDGSSLTFLDTPGHEAFKTMRQRGANVTDIVVLVVAADDGIMPQTIEAIKHAQNANSVIIVAANKMDKPGANLEGLKKALSENNVLVEDWGGEIPLVPISALKKDGIKELLEAINLQAEVLELKADPNQPASGVVLESSMKKGRGIVTDILIKNGTLKTGDYIVCGIVHGKTRAMTNDKGKTVKTVGPGYPVEFSGLDGVPCAGDPVDVVESESAARELVAHRKSETTRKEDDAESEKAPLSLDELFAAQDELTKRSLNVVIRTDVFGSLEAIKDAIAEIPTDKIGVRIISDGVGVISESDVGIAETTSAHIFGFNEKPDSKARVAAKRGNIDIHVHSIIYKLIEDVRESMENMLDPVRIETSIGKAEVKQAFSVSKIGIIAGSIVTSGKIIRNSHAKLSRDGEIISEGKISSLKRFKDDVKETLKGQECGIGVDQYTDIVAGDQLEAFAVEFEKARL